MDLAKDNALSAALEALTFQIDFRMRFFDLDVRFLGTAIVNYMILVINIEKNIRYKIFRYFLYKF